MPPPPNPTPNAAPTSRVRRDAVVRAVAALLRWLRHHPTPAPEPIYLLLTLKRAPARAVSHHLHLPQSPFPSISLVSDRVPRSLPDDIHALPSFALRSLPAAARRGLVLADRRIKGVEKTSKGGKVVPIDLTDPAWAEKAREMASCVELRVEPGTCRAVRVGHAAMTEEAVAANVAAAADAAAACVRRKWRNVRALHVKSPESLALPIYSAPGTGDADLDAAKREAVQDEEKRRPVKRRKKSDAAK